MEMENDLIYLQKFCESDVSKILKDCVLLKEAHALNRLGDCGRWQIIMRRKWTEQHDPPITSPSIFPRSSSSSTRASSRSTRSTSRCSS